jgi:hypothetical protein
MVSSFAELTLGGIVVKVGLQESVMRQRIIEALTYPRIMLLANLKLEECPHQLFFDRADKRCQHCDQDQECHWLNINDEFSVLAQKPMDSLFESLRFCIDYVDAQCSDEGHNVRRCACESCQWVTSARRLASEYRNSRRSHLSS